MNERSCRRLPLGLMLLGMIAMGCRSDAVNDPIGLDVIYAFAPAGNISLTADTDHIRPSGEMVLTVRGVSKVTGSGRIKLSSWSQEHGALLVIDSPIHDTIRNPAFQQPSTELNVSVMDFSFIAGQEFVIPWHLRMTNIEYHRFGATVTIDSAFILDSGRSYSSQSDTVKKYMHVPHGVVFDTDADAIEIELRP